jgi:mannose-6-phosphate isomerase, class I
MDLNDLYKLKGVVQHYSWGGYSFIPNLLGKSNPDHQPFAEYWLGAHPNYSAEIENGQIKTLEQLIRINPEVVLGTSLSKFRGLPYLLKVLDVRQMLSIQVHPNKSSAKFGFEEENKRGVPVNAPHRNYKDENHKPEMMVALGDFWLLHGFKSEEKIKIILKSKPEFNFLLPVFEKESYKGLYQKIMEMDQEEVNKILQPVLDKIIPLYEQSRLEKNDEDFWAARAAISFCKDNNYDRGIFSIYLFNLLHLNKGEAVFQPEGMPHAYLEGQNVEVMANSDNVLRAGLTDKHIDVKELMRHIKFQETVPEIINPSTGQKRVYYSEAEEFELSQYNLKAGEQLSIHSKTAEIYLLLKGMIEVHGQKDVLGLKQGEAMVMIAHKKAKIKAGADSIIFRVTIPDEVKK